MNQIADLNYLEMQIKKLIDKNKMKGFILSFIYKKQSIQFEIMEAKLNGKWLFVMSWKTLKYVNFIFLHFLSIKYCNQINLSCRSKESEKSGMQGVNLLSFLEANN